MGNYGSNRVINFMDELEKDRRRVDAKNSLENSPQAKIACYNKEIERGKDDCLYYIFKDIYKSSMPVGQDYIDSNNEKIDRHIKDFINNQTANKGIQCYMNEAIKRGNKAVKRCMESVDMLVKQNMPNMEDIPVLDKDSLNFKMDDDVRDELDKIKSDTGFDDVAEIIKQNVKASIEAEVERKNDIKRREKDIKDELRNNPSISTEAALEAAYSYKMGRNNGVYKPTLLEGIVIGRFSECATDDQDEQNQLFYEAVSEFTLHNITKALKADTYDLTKCNNLAAGYASGRIKF